MANALQTKIQGMREAKAAFQALPEAVRHRMGEAARVTASEIARVAASNVAVRYGFLKKHIRFTYNKNNGRARVGVTKGSERLPDGRTVDPARYAHFPEFGTVNHAAQPFMLPAAEGEKHAYLSRCRAAGKAIEGDMVAIGNRHL